MNDELLQQTIEGDLRTLWNLLQVEKDESPELRRAHDKVKRGNHIKVHVRKIIDKIYNLRDRDSTIIIDNTVYKLDDFYDEEDWRATQARSALKNHYMQDDSPYGGR